MYIDPRPATVRGNLAPATSFSVEINAAFIELITTTLYRNPIEAFTRELGQNALDTGAAVRIFAGSDINPEFRVEDDGPGMSAAFMADGYLRIAHSTKSLDPAAIGGWGIGRLSALSYSPTYTITTDDGQSRRSYIIANERTQLTARLLASGPSTQPGTVVQVPLQHADIRDVQAAALEWFGFAPVTWIAQSAMSAPAPTTRITIPGIAADAALYIDMPVGGIVLGGIFYRNSRCFSRMPTGVVIELPVNALALTAARDSLRSDATTRSILDTVAEACRSAMREHEHETMRGASLFDRIMFCRNNPSAITTILPEWAASDVTVYREYGPCTASTGIGELYYRRAILVANRQLSSDEYNKLGKYRKRTSAEWNVSVYFVGDIDRISTAFGAWSGQFVDADDMLAAANDALKRPKQRRTVLMQMANSADRISINMSAGGWYIVAPNARAKNNWRGGTTNIEADKLIRIAIQLGIIQPDTAIAILPSAKGLTYKDRWSDMEHAVKQHVLMLDDTVAGRKQLRLLFQYALLINKGLCPKLAVRYERLSRLHQYIDQYRQVGSWHDTVARAVKANRAAARAAWRQQLTDELHRTAVAAID